MNLDKVFSFNNKIIVVTGGASGIGEAISKAFAAQGATVAVVDLEESKAMKIAEELGNSSRGFACDVANYESVNNVAAAIQDVYKKVDVLVNSAGIVALAPAENLSLEAWNRTININLSGTFFMSQAIGKLMLSQGSGKIVNMASQAASIALDEHVAYCASKFGVLGITKVLASEWAGRGVNVNSISPTVVLTELGKKAWDGPKGDALKKLIPTGRFALPEEIAASALFLSSSAADMINGADLLVDGGYTIR
jgi:NAD(P)-dependent dehydrogenase (short-subunit alcohol dehydrogenase family)